MESKLYEECHEGGGFMAEQAMLKQDETVRTQIPAVRQNITWSGCSPLQVQEVYCLRLVFDTLGEQATL